jgi:hypothetical protein
MGDATGALTDERTANGCEGMSGLVTVDEEMFRGECELYGPGLE